MVEHVKNKKQKHAKTKHTNNMRERHAPNHHARKPRRITTIMRLIRKEAETTDVVARNQHAQHAREMVALTDASISTSASTSAI